MELALFVILAVIAVVSALGVILQPRVMHSVLFLLLNFVTLAALYILLNAQFIAMVQIIVYAGAIAVLFLFAVMLLGEYTEKDKGEHDLLLGYQKLFAFLLGGILLAEVGYVLATSLLSGVRGTVTPEVIAQQGNVQTLGAALFTRFLLPFELASVLLVVGIVGAVVLAKRKL